MKNCYQLPICGLLLIVLLFLSACSTYLGVATDKESQHTYITYTKSFLFFSTSGVILCERQGDGHLCRKVDVTPADGPVASSAASPRAETTFGAPAINPPVPSAAPGTPAPTPPAQPKTRAPLPAKADKPTGEMVFDREDALATATVTLPSWRGSYVVIHLKDGRQIEGELALVSGLDVRVRTEAGTWSGTLTEVERLTRY